MERDFNLKKTKEDKNKDEHENPFYYIDRDNGYLGIDLKGEELKEYLIIRKKKMIKGGTVNNSKY